MLAIVKLSYLLVYSNKSLARVMLEGELFYFINVKKIHAMLMWGLIWYELVDLTGSKSTRLIDKNVVWLKQFKMTFSKKVRQQYIELRVNLSNSWFRTKDDDNSIERKSKQIINLDFQPI